MLPSFYASSGRARSWSVARAACYGVGLGVLAALFKILGPGHATALLRWRLLEIAGAAAVFAVLCGGAAALRNFIARRLIWPDMR